MSDSATQEITAILQLASVENNCVLSAFTIYLFDRCLAFGQEVELIWCRPRSVVSALAWQTYIAATVFEIMYFAVLSLISALRVYAISSQDWRVPLIVFMLAIMRSAFQIFKVVTSSCTAVPPPLGSAIGSLAPQYETIICLAYFNADVDTNANAVITVALAASIAADAIVLIVTWCRTYRIRRLARQENIHAPLTSLLLRDGTIYFGLLVVINCLNIIFEGNTNQAFDGFVFFGTAFSSIILSRFCLNLREVGRTTNDVLSSIQTTPLSDLHFSRGVDGFGASLSFRWDDSAENVDADTGGTDEADVMDASRSHVHDLGEEADGLHTLEDA
ncbi:uncharacterized protein C8Q71DRAFT_863522 [Rhodofomes roseus]|uniref:Uncharacterized protein n=1 Tax=Rhodofomes roseus TaxID=34475 RepID=A0ABQ8JYI1_9APHY|nr:uncharacterized protein C8Q71DRAFT_863522 [Rhodofomes roseus]KAH9829077.1 hypothetical protein C8Q71DRAFT_863522 [Rhodofomes roseus]